MELSIPKEATRVVVLIRHSLAEKEGLDKTRNLTDGGRELCQHVRPAYLNLMTVLESRFRDVGVCDCSPFRRASETCLTIFDSAALRHELGLQASLTKIDGGEWFKEHKEKGLTTREMIQIAISTVHPLDDQPWDEAKVNYLNYILCRTQRFKVAMAVCHEPHISQAGLNHFLLEELGLLECEALIFYCKGDEVVGAEKFVPSI